MNVIASIAIIDQKMAEMRLKNLELLKRHQEIEEDRQFAVRTGATTIIVETNKDNKTMRGATKNRVRITPNPQNAQGNPSERIQRPPIRRKFENTRNDTQPQRAQRIDYNRLKHEHAQEINNPKQNNNSITPELHQYVYPFHYQSENNHDADEPAHAKRLVIVNNKADRIGSGRFSQQQRTQEHGQRKREERMRRCAVPNNGHTGGMTNEFHLDVPSMPIWPNSPIHVQLLPTNINNHHAGIDHLINTSGDQIDQTAYMHNFVYSPPAQASPFNGNGTVYFTHPAPPSSLAPSSQTHFHQYHQARAFDNTNRHQFHLPSFQSSPIFQPSVSSPSNNHQPPQQQETSPTDLPPRYRHVRAPDYENKLLQQQRPMSGDFDRLHNSHHSLSSRSNDDHRFQARPQSFYDFSSSSSANNSNNNNNNNNNFFRSSNNNRFQRNNNNNTSLPLSAYMNTDDSLHDNENMNTNNHWATSHQRRRPTQQQQQQQQPQQQQRTYHQDKHQFPLSSYDPRQYGFNNTYQRRNNFNNGANVTRRNINTNRNNNNNLNDSNDIDLIEEWWEDNNTELIGTSSPVVNTTTMVDDSGNSSLSTSMNLKESISEDLSTNDFINPSSDVSTTDSNIIESIDKLQQQLKLEEAVDERLGSPTNGNIELNDGSSNKEPTTYDTAHFMQWAKEKFREELAGRLTAQEIQQHDAVTTDDDDDDDDDDNHCPPSTTRKVEKMDALEDDLHEKLIIEENQPNTTRSFLRE